jgi:hypothetical protein
MSETLASSTDVEIIAPIANPLPFGQENSNGHHRAEVFIQDPPLFCGESRLDP